MSLLQLLTRDLVNKIGAIGAFGGNVSATLGGTEADPTMANLPLPFAWVLFTSSQTASQDRERWSQIRQNFSVYVNLAYGKGETNFVEQQLTLIEQVGMAVTGTKIDALGNRPQVWAFDGLSVYDVEPTVIRYEMTFSIPIYYTQSL